MRGRVVTAAEAIGRGIEYVAEGITAEDLYRAVREAVAAEIAAYLDQRAEQERQAGHERRGRSAARWAAEIRATFGGAE